MRKVLAFIIVFAMVFMAAGTALSLSVLPVTDFSDWEEYQKFPANPVIFNTFGPFVNVITDGTISEAWGSLYKIYSGSIGILATVKVVNVNGNAHVGLWKYLGSWGDHKLLAEIRVQQFNVNGVDTRTITYRIRERDAAHETVREWSLGHFGDFQGEWEIGNAVTIGLLRVGGEIWFFSPGYGTIKWMPPIPMGTIDSEVQITGWAESGAGNDINAWVAGVVVVLP